MMRFNPYRDSIMDALRLPVESLSDMSGGLKALAPILGAMAFIWSDAYLAIAFLMCVAMIADWAVGSHFAKVSGKWDRYRASTGWLIKGTALIQTLMVRGVEYWLSQHATGVDTNGFLATTLAMGFLLAELDSIDQTRVKAGASPSPVWGRVRGFLDHAMERIFQTEAPTRKVHREDHQKESEE